MPTLATPPPSPPRSTPRPSSQRNDSASARVEAAEGEWGEVAAPPPGGSGALPRVGLGAVGGGRAVTDDLLQPGETIILLLKPSPLFIVLMPLRFLVMVALVTAAGVYLNGLITFMRPTDIYLLGIAVAGGRLFWELLEWLARVYVLTDQRIITTAGVVRVSISELPLRRVQHTNLLFPLRERLLGLGTLGFSTAGTGMVEAHWRTIARPLEVHRQVVHAIRKYGR